MSLQIFTLALLATTTCQANPLHAFLSRVQAPAPSSQKQVSDSSLVTHSTDCLFAALPASCDSHTDSEPTRMQTAASLALCDLTAAGLSVPFECRSGSSIHACVEALGRSPQAWSSYAGYLRSDLLGVCATLRQQQQVDQARSLYANASQTMLELLHALTRAESDSASRDEQEFEQRQGFAAGLQTVHSDLLRGLKSFEALTQQLQDGLSEHHRQTQASSEALDTIITQFRASVQQMELVPEQASRVLADRTISLIDLLTTSLIKNDDALGEIASKHRAALQDSLELALARVDASAGPATDALASVEGSLHAMDAILHSHYGALSQAAHQAGEVVSTMALLDDSLSRGVALAYEQQSIHNASLRLAESLHSTIAGASDKFSSFTVSNILPVAPRFALAALYILSFVLPKPALFAAGVFMSLVPVIKNGLALPMWHLRTQPRILLAALPLLCLFLFLASPRFFALAQRIKPLKTDAHPICIHHHVHHHYVPPPRKASRISVIGMPADIRTESLRIPRIRF